MDTAELIFKALKEKGKTQQSLADAIGVTKFQISEWKRGKTRSYTEHLSEIAKFLDVTTDYLLGNEQKNKPAAESDELNDLLKDPELKEIYENLMKLSPDGIQRVLEFVRFQHEQETK